MRKMGEVFLLRANIAAVGSVLDSPDVFWVSASTSAADRDAQPLTTSGPQSYPDLRPLYDAARSYLEIPQRINLLNTRVEVLQDMLQLLKESVSSRHSERLEQIVIVLIAIEISMFLSYSFNVPILTLPLSPWDHYYPRRPLRITYYPEQLDAHAYIHFVLLLIVHVYLNVRYLENTK
jgi:Uncharacterised ACR, YagE family COG1723